jgi:hypothetical protein
MFRSALPRSFMCIHHTAVRLRVDLLLASCSVQLLLTVFVRKFAQVAVFTEYLIYEYCCLACTPLTACLYFYRRN